MNDTETKGKPLNLNETHRSDGSELIPAEVQANTRSEQEQSVDDSSVSGYTVDDEGLVNNYAIEPGVYPSEYPSPQQQRKYVLLGAGAILFVVILILISLNVS